MQQRSAAVSLATLTSMYGKRWQIIESAGGGWIAVRHHGLSARALARGLSNVRGGNTLEELAKHLATETALEDRPLLPALRRPVDQEPPDHVVSARR
ncbi:hypothetical protein AB0M95_26575 [Sphaerisporangium sp. NPDC051017]|uniref:hypothetical protein n=1 Tax=Sphaerisporangium sp. NPDC051017 TaxID=3154636 RepID=UPI003436390A